jgi:hypothetical protein
MQQSHSFYIGNVLDLVRVDDYLDILSLKLANLECIYCERTFVSNQVLREHLRKKKHFSVCKSNSLYHQFYISNYSPQELQNNPRDEELEEEVDDDVEDDDWDEPCQTMCLFDDEMFDSPMECQSHLSNVHGFNLENADNFYQGIQIINYIRHQSYLGLCCSCHQEFNDITQLSLHYNSTNHHLNIFNQSELWNHPNYMFPYYENDPLLTIDYQEASHSQ